MGCNQSSSKLVTVHIKLDQVFFKQELVIRKVMPSTKVSEIMYEVKTMLLKDSTQASKLKFRVTYRNEKFSSSSSKTLDDIGFNDKDTIQVHCRELNYQRIKLSIHICDTPDKTLLMRIPRSSTVASLKNRILSQGHLNNKIFHIIWNDLQLEDEKTFEFYGIEDNDILIVLHNPRKITSRTAEKTKGWKLKNSGFVLEGVCQNDRCVAFKQRVSIPMGLGDFNVLAEMSVVSKHHCPMCELPIGRISSCGFIYCSYRIKGVLNDDSYRDFQETKGAYEEFVKYENLNWKELKVTVGVREESSRSLTSVTREDSNFGSETSSSATLERVLRNDDMNEVGIGC